MIGDLESCNFFADKFCVTHNQPEKECRKKAVDEWDRLRLKYEETLLQLDEERKAAWKKLALVILGNGGTVGVDKSCTLLDLSKYEIVDSETPWGWQLTCREKRVASGPNKNERHDCEHCSCSCSDCNSRRCPHGVAVGDGPCGLCG